MDARPRPHLPIAVGFWLLSLPLWIAVPLAGNPAGAWTNAAAALVMVVLGLVVAGRRG